MSGRKVKREKAIDAKLPVTEGKVKCRDLASVALLPPRLAIEVGNEQP
jgi:hypothetical protein